MGFENQKHNYKTAGEINGSIQDKIDEGKLDIKKITQDKLDKLKVSIFNEGSNLSVWDSGGELISKLENDKRVKFNGEIKEKKGKYFLGIDLKGGKKGFISADYVKGEIKDGEAIVSGEEKEENKVIPKKKENLVIPEKKEKEEKQISIDDALINFKESIKTAEKNDLMTDSEERKEMQIIIQQGLIEIQEAISQEEKKEKPDNSKINKAKLYIAKYFSDLTDDGIDNRHWKNRDISTNIALQILPEKNKPEPISEETINNAVIKNVGVMNYIKSIAKNPGNNPTEKLEEIHKTSVWKEMIENLNDEYKDTLEDYLENLDEKGLDEEQNEALDLLKDIHGIGFFDISEDNFDMFQDLGANIGIIAGSMYIGTKTGAAIGGATGFLAGGIGAIPGAIIGAVGGAIAGGVTATIGVSAYNGDSDQINAKEFGLNIATMGFISGAAKVAKVVGNIERLGKTKGLASLGTEIGIDIAGAGMTVDYIRSELYENYDYNFSESFISNLQWALIPIATRAMGKSVKMIPEEQIKAGKDAIAGLKLASLIKKAGGDNSKVLKNLEENLDESIKKTPENVNKEGNSVLKSNTDKNNPISKDKNNFSKKEDNLSARKTIDLDNPKIGDRVKIGDDVYEYGKYESSPGANGSYAWFKEIEGVVKIDVNTPQFQYNYQIKDKLGGNRFTENQKNQNQTIINKEDNNQPNEIKQELEKAKTNKDFLDGYASTPITFFRGNDGKVYIKTMDHKFFNNGVEVKLDHKVHLREIKNRNTSKTKNKESEKIYDDIENQPNEIKQESGKDKKSKQDDSVGPFENKKTNEVIGKKENTIFENMVKKELKENGIYKNGDFEITVNAKSKYIINGDISNPLSFKDAIKKIPLEIKKGILNNKAINDILQSWESNKLKLEDGVDIIRNKVTGETEVYKNGIEIKDKKIIEETLSSPKVRESIIIKNISNIPTNIFIDAIKNLPGLMKEIDKKLSSLPFFMKPYSFSKAILYNSGKAEFRQPIHATLNSIGTPYKIFKDLKESNTFGEYSKTILFANKDISVLGGIGKVGLYSAGYTAIEEYFKYKLFDDYELDLHSSELVQTYISNMYLGIINSIIIDLILQDEDTKTKTGTTN